MSTICKNTGNRQELPCINCTCESSSSTAEFSDSIPFKPETWPVDADGFTPDLCTECGTPVRYGSRHSACGRKAMGLPPVERTVASIPDDDLLRRAVRSVVQRRPKRKEFAWAAVSEVFGLGSTFSAQLCRRFGLDPDTGADLKTPNTTDEGREASRSI